MTGLLDLVSGAFAGIFILFILIFVVCMFFVNPLLGIAVAIIIYIWITH